MNKKLFLLITFVLSLGLGFTACGEDEEDNTVDYAEQIEGTYNGTLIVDLGAAGGEQTLPEEDIIIKRIADNSVELSLENFSFGLMTIGDITIKTTVTENKGVINLADATLPDYSLAEGTLKATIKLSSASIDENNELTLKIKVTKIVGNGGVTIPDVAVDFTGDKK